MAERCFVLTWALGSLLVEGEQQRLQVRLEGERLQFQDRQGGLRLQVLAESLEVAAPRPVGGELRPLATERPGGKHRVTSHQLFIDGPCIGLAYKWVSS